MRPGLARLDPLWPSLAPDFLGRALGVGLEPGGNELDGVYGPGEILRTAMAAESWSRRNWISRGSRGANSEACDSVRVPLRNAAKKAGSRTSVRTGGGAIKVP
jgi:hypothetical protein